MAYKYHKSDFSLIIELNAKRVNSFGEEIVVNTGYPFELKFFSSKQSSASAKFNVDSLETYVASYDGTSVKNCNVLDDTHVLVYFDHTEFEFSPGMLYVETHSKVPDTRFEGDEVQNIKRLYTTGIELTDIADLDNDDNSELKIDLLMVYFTGVNNQIETAEAARVQAETARAVAEIDRISSEITRKEAEQERQQAEARRDTLYSEAEALRNSSYQVSEAERNTKYAAAEGKRENTFTQEEQVRSTAENERMVNETNRNEVFAIVSQKYPVIIDGNWWVWNQEAGKYQDTGWACNSDYLLTQQKIITAMPSLTSVAMTDDKTEYDDLF